MNSSSVGLASDARLETQIARLRELLGRHIPEHKARMNDLIKMLKL